MELINLRATACRGEFVGSGLLSRPCGMLHSIALLHEVYARPSLHFPSSSDIGLVVVLRTRLTKSAAGVWLASAAWLEQEVSEGRLRFHHAMLAAARQDCNSRRHCIRWLSRAALSTVDLLCRPTWPVSRPDVESQLLALLSRGFVVPEASRVVLQQGEHLVGCLSRSLSRVIFSRNGSRFNRCADAVSSSTSR
jgi:hypothetical protein